MVKDRGRDAEHERQMELGLLLAGHVECEACEAYTRHVAGGEDPRDVIGLRCGWAAQLQREMFPGEEFR